MLNEIFNSNQVELLPFIKGFQRSFYLVGGTAIALHLGHSRSIDFDLLCIAPLDKSRIKGKLLQIPYKQTPIFEDFDQLHLLINDVKVTFFSYPYPIVHPVSVNSIITILSLIILGRYEGLCLEKNGKMERLR